MKNQLITNIHIKDFKCFDDFKAKGFSRVNLIGGKNNVGKTSFMEACYVNSFAFDLSKFLGGLNSIKVRRESFNILHNDLEHSVQNFIEKSDGIFVETNINKISFKIKTENKGIREYEFEFNHEPFVTVNVNEFSFFYNLDASSIFIGTYGFSNGVIIEKYASIQKRDADTQLNEYLNNFDPSIESFKVIGSEPQCRYDGKYFPITELGDGVRHLVSIIISLSSAENGHLFIDEIGNGIHYTKLDGLWEIILKLSKELNVQVFATTHSKECIESFNRVQLKLKNKESSYFELAKEKDTSKIFMSALPPSQLEYELSHKGKFRGE